MPQKDPEERKAYQRAYYAANREKSLNKSKAWREANPDRARELNLNWRKTNHERCKKPRKAKRPRSTKREREKSQRQRDFLRDIYIRRLLSDGTTMKPSDVPQILVDTHRELINLKRAINEKL